MSKGGVPAGPNELRREVETGATAERHPPHVTDNADGAPVQKELPSPDAAPILPANAQGDDEFPVEQRTQKIDPASMYDRRPAEDKDTPPSETGGQ